MARSQCRAAGNRSLRARGRGKSRRIYVTGFLGRSTVASSADGGVTWRLRKPITTDGFPPFHVVVDRTAPNAVIVEAGLGLKRSTDTGATWLASSPRFVAAPVADQMTGGALRRNTLSAASACCAAQTSA